METRKMRHWNKSLKSSLALLALCLCVALVMIGCDTGSLNAVSPSPEQTSADAETPAPSAVFTPYQPTEPMVAITVGDQPYDIVPFLQEKVITVDQGGGKVNEVELTGKAVRMRASTCDNQDCVHQGDITLDNYEERVLMGWIICLPNQVSIEFVPGGGQ